MRTVLVTGANGFIAGFVIVALQRAGLRVIRGVQVPRPDAADERRCDFMALNASTNVDALLEDVDAVVNAAGILRETSNRHFEQIHHRGPLALARACEARGIRSFVQISALGLACDGEFVASKHRFDEALLRLDLDAVVLRPSVVYSTRGSYGGTTALRAHAAWPGLMLIPGSGQYRIQPIAAEDLAAVVVAAATGHHHGTFDVAGPSVVSLREYLLAWRSWLRLDPARQIEIPERWVGWAARLSDWVGRGPMGITTWRMLSRGNVASDGAVDRLHGQFGVLPRELETVLESEPSQVQDRWHARLHALKPFLNLGLIALLMLSAWAGFVTPTANIEALTQETLLGSLQPVAMARVAGGLDLTLAFALLLIGPRQWIMAAIFALVAAYTVVFGALLPQLWFEPLGGIAKNLVVLPAVATLWILGDER